MDFIFHCAYFQTFHVRRFDNVCSINGKVTEAIFPERQPFQPFTFKRLKNVLADLTVQSVVSLLWRQKQKRRIKQVEIWKQAC